MEQNGKTGAKLGGDDIAERRGQAQFEDDEVVGVTWRRRGLVTILVGVDLQPIHEVESAMRRYGSRYTRRLFTDHERDQCGEDPSMSAASLAARFAAKEAVFKALVVDQAVPTWKSIEVHEHQRGRHSIRLAREAEELAESRGVVGMTLSIDEAGGVAIATVTATTRDAGASR